MVNETLFTTDFWYMAPILSSITVIIASAINNQFGIKKFWAQLVSWGVASVLGVGTWALNLIALGTPTWLSVVCLCVVVGLSSNGIYDIPTIKDYVNKFFKRKTE